MPNEQYIPRMMPMNPDSSISTIKDAFGALNSGIQNYQIGKSINDANETIQNLTQQEASDSDIRQARNNFANDIGQKMLAFGFPANHAQLFMDSFAGPQVNYVKPQNLAGLTYNASQEKAQGIENGPQQQSLQMYQDSQDQLNQSKGAAKAANGGSDAADEKQTAAQDKQLNKVADNILKSKASSRSALGRLTTSELRIKELQTGLLSDPNGQSTFNAITKGEIPQVLNSVLTGSVGTAAGTEHLMPQTNLNMRLTDLQNQVTSGLRPYNSPEVVNAYKDIVNRMADIIPAQERELQKDAVRGETKLARTRGDDLSAKTEAAIHNPDGSLEKAYYQNGRVRFTSDDKMDQLEAGFKDILKNPKDIKKNPNDPNNQDFFNQLKRSPFYMQALQAKPGLQNIVVRVGKQLQGDK